jgi:hypothetical protein
VQGVTVGSVSASAVIFHNSGFIECTFPAHPTGPVPVTVVPAAVGGAPPVPLAFTYAYPAPVLENARPRLSVYFFLFFLFIFVNNPKFPNSQTLPPPFSPDSSATRAAPA